jgi:hypothetical protein
MEIVRCRIKRYEWWTVPGCFFLSGLMLFACVQGVKEQPDIFWPMWVMSSLMGLACCAGAFWVTRSLLYQEVIADETGLRWRNPFGPWKSARWDEISDFSFKGLKQLPTIQTPSAKITLITELTNREAMMAVVAARAVNAPAREWEIEKFRASKNFTQRFDYWTRSQKWMVPLMSVGVVYVLGFVGWSAFFGDRASTTTRYQLSWQFDFLSIVMAILFFAPFVTTFAFGLWMGWQQRNFAYNRRNEHLEISLRGLAWQNLEQRIEASWQEVRAIDLVPGRRLEAHYRVETANGDFSVWTALESISLWVGLVRQFAPHLNVEVSITDPDLGGEAETWSGGEIGKGTRTFHFRTRDTRLVLWALTAFVLVLPLLPVLNEGLKTPDDVPSPISGRFWIAVLLVGVALLTYGSGTSG